MLIQNKTREIIREMSEITGLSFNQIKDIVLTSQFKFVVEQMAKGERGNSETFKNVMLRFLGTFESSPGKIYYMTKALEEKKRREEEDEIC